VLVRKHAPLKRLWLKAARRRARKPAPKSPPRKRHPIRVALFKLVFAALVLWALVAAAYYAWALTFDLTAIREMPQRSVVLDRDGKFYSRLSGENRIVAPFDQISNNFVNALITREDSRFYSHHGVDPIGIARAIVRNFLFHSAREGASTITQQLARNSFPLGGKNMNRKLVEAALAFRIETELTKEEILEAYMNRIYFGSGFYGIDTASRGYFGKPASRLSLGEAALLAGLIRSPSRISPFNNPDAAVKNRDVVLKRMHELDLIDSAQLAGALREPLRLAQKPNPAPEENWAMETIRRELELVVPEDRLADGGLKVYTTIDPELQDVAEKSLARRLAQIERRPGYPHPAKDVAKGADYLQGALLMLDNRTGGIRAVAGGRDYSDSKYHRAFDARRQAGSTVKPFVFATAFAHGVRPGDIVSDTRLSPGEIPRDLGHYDPSNSDGQSRGDIRVGDALIDSRNTASVRVGLRAGLPAAADTLQRAGLAEHIAPYPSLCLGAFETTLKDLTAAYTAFPRAGVRLQPYLVEKVVDADGITLFEATRGKIRFLDERAANLTTGLLEQVLTHGTASNAHGLGLRKHAAGKTGTTDQFRDAWFVGFTKSLTCGVWVGFDRPQTILRGGYGADLALPVWVDVIQAADARKYPD
jgi:penicillin-binding protein 1A